MLLRSPNGGLIDASDTHAPLLLANGWTYEAKEEPTRDAPDLTGMTVAELLALCAERGVAVPRRATKARRVRLLSE